MRKLGIKFGAYHIYVPLSLKPAPRELALTLFALANGGVRQAGVGDIPHIVLSGRTSFEVDPDVDPRLYEVAGFKVAGKRAVRVDILERLADIIRPLIALDPSRVQGEAPAGAAEGNGFRVTVEMTSLLGCSGEDFNSILASLGYRVRRTPKPPAPVAAPAEASAEAPALDAALSEVPSGAVAVQTDDVAPMAAEPAPALAEAAPGLVDGVIDEAAEAAEIAAAPAEPEFDEVWFPGGRRNEARRHEHKPRREGGDGQGRRSERGPHKGPRRAEGEERPHGKPHRGKARPDQGERPERRPAREERKTFDPDSPFAALAALRGKTE
jgi:ATP-dependent RNA helicase SUPV3L1/SUV3